VLFGELVTQIFDFSQHMIAFNTSSEILIRVSFLVSTIVIEAVSHYVNFVHASNLSMDQFTLSY